MASSACQGGERHKVVGLGVGFVSRRQGGMQAGITPFSSTPEDGRTKGRHVFHCRRKHKVSC